MNGFSRTLLASLVVFALAPAALADEAKAGATKAKSAARPAAKLVTMTPDQMKWVPNPGAAEIKMAVAWGDADKGPHAAFHKFPAGFTAPLHTHTADLRIAVISGTLVESTEGGAEVKLPAGSYVYQPHTVKHVTKCDAGSECVIFVVASGKFDIVMADAKKAEEKK